MTDREKAIVSAYTGVTMLAGDKFQIFHKYIEQILGRPVWTHELGNELVWNEIKEKSKNDFIEICKTEDKTEERPKGEWVVLLDDDNIQTCKCSICGRMVDIACYKFDKYPFCHCGADMRGGRE